MENVTNREPADRKGQEPAENLVRLAAGDIKGTGDINEAAKMPQGGCGSGGVIHSVPQQLDTNQSLINPGEGI